MASKTFFLKFPYFPLPYFTFSWGKSFSSRGKECYSYSDGLLKLQAAMQVHTCLPHMQDPIYIFCETIVNKKEYEQPVMCPTCFYADVKVEIKNQVRNQVENQIKVHEHKKKLITFTTL